MLVDAATCKGGGIFFGLANRLFIGSGAGAGVRSGKLPLNALGIPAQTER
jgi:hypothetical protein